VKITVYVETNRVGSRVERTVEVDDEDLEGLTEPERFTLLNDYARDAVFDGGMAEWGWEEATS
jgi:hypothetical protein